ncbi:MAG: hypothetical protein JWN52_181 [Actinomycetia bacterium]|nr:hypothetical protein [Actinomycetes bacterium]
MDVVMAGQDSRVGENPTRPTLSPAVDLSATLSSDARSNDHGLPGSGHRAAPSI